VQSVTSDHYSIPTAAAPPGRPRANWLLLTVLALTVAAVAVDALWFVSHHSESQTFPEWQASQYWLNYANGFTRRGLPGQLLSWIVGGTPTHTEAKAAGLTLSAVAVLAIIGLAANCFRRNQPAAVLAAAVVITSPFTISLILRDLGRYDAVGVIVLFLLSAEFSWRRVTSPWLAGIIVAALTLIATASEEFLVAYLLPVGLVRVLLACRRQPGLPRDRTWLLPRKGEWAPLALALGPSLLLFIASYAIRPSTKAVGDAARAAAANGVVRPRGQSDALSVLTNGVRAEVRVVLHVGAAKLALWIALMIVLYAVSVGVIPWLLRFRPSATYWLCAVWLGIVAFALSCLGIDYRRWWGLAFMTIVSVAVMMRSAGHQPDSAVDRRWTKASIVTGLALLLISLPVSRMPIFPS
jgi:hypothetical protein